MSESTFACPARDGWIPVSVRQERLLQTKRHLAVAGPGRPIRQAFRIAENVDLDRFWDAVQEVFRGECALNSVIREAGSGWQTRVASSGVSNFHVVGHDEFDEMLKDDWSGAFRVGFAPARRLLFIGVDHIWCDGQSMLVLLRRVVDRYLGLPHRPGPCYHEYSEHWRAALAAGAFNDSRQYWSEHLKRYGQWPEIGLPGLVTRRPRQAIASRTVALECDAGETASIAANARSWRVSPFFAYLWGAVRAFTVLQDQSGAFGVEIGTGGRTFGDTASTVGFLADYVSIGLGDLPADDGRARAHLVAQTMRAIRHAVYPRHQLLELSPDYLPARANALFVVVDATEARAERYTRGLLLNVTSEFFPEPEGPRAIPGLILTARMRADGTAELSVSSAESDLPPEVASAFLERWQSVMLSERR